MLDDVEAPPREDKLGSTGRLRDGRFDPRRARRSRSPEGVFPVIDEFEITVPTDGFVYDELLVSTT